MFTLIAVRDTVPVEAKASGIPPHITIRDALNKKYANKLVPKHGLALSVFDILTAEDGKVTWGNGIMYYKVSFRLLMFAPFEGEIIVGTVMETTQQFIRVSLGFFQDVYVPANLLPVNSMYDHQENRYFWISADEDRPYSPAELLNTVKADRLYIDPGEPIRVRVDSLEWQDVRPKTYVPEPEPPVANGHVNGGTTDNVDSAAIEAREREKEEDNPMRKAGMKIIAGITESGLGITSWWTDGPDEGEVNEGVEAGAIERGEQGDTEMELDPEEQAMGGL